MGAEAIRLLTKRNDDAVRLGRWAVRARRHGKFAHRPMKMSERPQWGSVLYGFSCSSPFSYRCSPVAAISIGSTEAESKVLCERPIVMRPSGVVCQTGTSGLDRKNDGLIGLIPCAIAKSKGYTLVGSLAH